MQRIPLRVFGLAALLSSAATGAPPPPAARTVKVSSTPASATVLLDGAAVGSTPLDVVVPARGKHVIVVTLTGFEPITRRVDTARDGETIDLTLVDADLARLERELKKAQVAHDKANTRLEIAQEQSTAAPDSNAKSRTLEKAELAMQAATETLEEAEKALNQTKKNRMTDRERADAANKVRAAMERPPPPSPGTGAPVGGAPVVRNGGTVFCAWEVPVKGTQPGKTWVNIRNGCFAAPVSAANASCNQRAKAESPDATGCDCTDDIALAAKCR